MMVKVTKHNPCSHKKKRNKGKGQKYYKRKMKHIRRDTNRV